MAAQKKMLRVDSHTHILPRNIPDWKSEFGYGGFIRLEHHVTDWALMKKDDGTFFREVEGDIWDATARLEYMDKMGIDVQVCSTVPTMFSYWSKPEDCLKIAKYLNDDLAKTCQDYPDRFIALGTLPMNDPDLAIQEARRCINELGMAGFQIASHLDTTPKMTLDNPKLFPIFQECERLGAAIMVHPWDMMGKDFTMRYWLPWLVGMPAETSLAICSFIFGGIFERLPKLRVLFAHAGGSFPATVGRIKHGFDCRPDLCARDNDKCPTEYLGRFWVDHLTHSEEQLGAVINLIGEDKVCFGTDYPFPLGECYPLKKPAELIYRSSLNRDCKELIMGKNVLAWLNLPSESFMNSSHRADKPPEDDIESTTNPSLAGTYAYKDAGQLTLELSGRFILSHRTSEVEGLWKVGTYTRTGDVNKDVVLIVEKDSTLKSEFSRRRERKIVLSDDMTRAHEVDKFAFANLKRCSGKNDMLEGEKREDTDRRLKNVKANAIEGMAEATDARPLKFLKISPTTRHKTQAYD
jgi:aminocarboxymuconate-semialdehyde decarboxylase